MTFEIINPEELGAPRGWNNGMLGPAGGRVLFVAGQTARGSQSEADLPPGFVDQFAAALEHVITVVRQAGGGPEHLGRLTLYVTDIDAYRDNLKPLGEVYRRHMGRHYPAMALVAVSSLVDPTAQIEIEGTAVLPATP